MAGLGAKDILRNITALEQLIEEINFQRAKEMRQCLMSKDSDTSFVIVHGTTYWTDLFVRHFLFQTDRSTDADDLLFFIRKKQVKGPRYIPKYQTEVEVYRKDSRKLPIGDPDIDWEETVYLNLIIHQFDYTLTLAVCTRTSPKELQVLKRHSQKVYASPSRRRMDTKGEVEEITYPNVCFHVDNFDEVFADMLVRDGEMVCVELVAADHGGSRQAVIFLGSIRYDALKRVYDTRASLSSKVAQRMMLGLFAGAASQRIEFVRMKGPQGKGHAEMAVTKPKGSGVETPTSEPGVSLTDLWDSDWDDEPDDRFLCRHQRRLSDPSANFNTFINSGWVSKAEGRSRSENEGLDNFANGLYEIESGDVRDAVCSCRCCSVACRRKCEEEDDLVDVEGLCKKCEHFHGKQNIQEHLPPAVPPSVPSEGSRESPTEFSPTCEDGESVGERRNGDEVEVVLGVEASENETDYGFGNYFVSQYDNKHDAQRSNSPNELDPFLVEDTTVGPKKGSDSPQSPNKERGKCSLKEKSQLNRLFSLRKKKRRTPGSAVRVNSTPDLHQGSLPSTKEYIPLSTTENVVKTCAQTPSSERIASMTALGESTIPPTLTNSEKLRIPSAISPEESTIPPTLAKPEELRISSVITTEESRIPSMTTPDSLCHSQSRISEKRKRNLRTKSKQGTSPPCPNTTETDPDTLEIAQKVQINESVAITSINSPIKLSSGPIYFRSLSLDPKKVETFRSKPCKTPRCFLIKSRSSDDVGRKKVLRRKVSIPFRVTKDGTFVYFPCDIKLDDGAYNPLWTTKGFTQTFHFWKESRRAQSAPLNAYLTYVTLPWFTIITDILDHRTGPILTF